MPELLAKGWLIRLSGWSGELNEIPMRRRCMPDWPRCVKRLSCLMLAIILAQVKRKWLA